MPWICAALTQCSQNVHIEICVPDMLVLPPRLLWLQSSGWKAPAVGAGDSIPRRTISCRVTLDLRAPYTVKQICATAWETVSIYDTIYKVVQIWPGLFTLVYIQISPGHIWTTLYLRKFQSLGKCHNESMSKAACLAIILAYATEEETVYRKRSIWPKYYLKNKKCIQAR